MRTSDGKLAFSLRALQAEFRGIGRGFDDIVAKLQEPVGGVVMSRELRRENASFPTLLPLRPIWPGFAFNTLFYSA